MVAVQNLLIAVCFVTVLLSSKAISRPLHKGQAETGVNANTVLEKIYKESINIYDNVSHAG